MDEVVTEVCAELASARERYGPMNSYHEGYAVMLEEFEELWDEIKKRPGVQDRDLLRREAVQVAAMALRFLVDLC